ncbi:DoxX family protein [Brevundimonas sp.]|uniref:DoxX family protein n=1 Tax=Brevundimonas sp. TaxID=1871086 RepID=UPI00261158CE|nr:DoxX family protein [Brevundimonas sp.]
MRHSLSLEYAAMSEQTRTAAWGIALLRIALGIMFLAHSLLLKLMTFGLSGTAAFFHSVGLPGWLAYLTFAVEVVGGLMLVMGIHARLAAAALAPFMLGALVTVHWTNGWVFTAPGGGWEYAAYLLVLCIAQVLLGDGALALAPSRNLGPAPKGPLVDGARPYELHPAVSYDG